MQFNDNSGVPIIGTSPTKDGKINDMKKSLLLRNSIKIA